MTATQTDLTRRKLTTPRAAAIAGILFALLYGASLVLIRSSIPADRAADSQPGLRPIPERLLWR